MKNITGYEIVRVMWYDGQCVIEIKYNVIKDVTN